jgi:hypothetical protein
MVLEQWDRGFETLSMHVCADVPVCKSAPFDVVLSCVGERLRVDSRAFAII